MEPTVAALERGVANRHGAPYEARLLLARPLARDESYAHAACPHGCNRDDGPASVYEQDVGSADGPAVVCDQDVGLAAVCNRGDGSSVAFDQSYSDSKELHLEERLLEEVHLDELWLVRVEVSEGKHRMVHSGQIQTRRFVRFQRGDSLKLRQR